MTGAIASFAAMAVLGRELSAELDTFEIMAYRSVIGFPIILAIMAATGRMREVRTRAPRLQTTRNVIHFAAQNCWFYGVATIPLAQLVAIEFTNPIWVALLAPVLLAERMTKAGMLAAALGFLGILVVARPGVAPLELGHLMALFAAIGFALTNIYTRMLSRSDTTMCVLFWMTLSQTVMGFACAAPGGITLPSADLAPMVGVIGVCGLTAHFCLTRALFAAPASVVAPMEFMRLPVIAVAAAFLYGEPLEVAVFAGAALIVLGNLVNLRAGRRR